jgi:hypothetical protein
MIGLKRESNLFDVVINICANIYRLKTANEEKQRYTRKLRAEGKMPPHEARWFKPTTDEDTQEKLWQPRRDANGEVLFWSRREEAGKKGDWEDVETIFATD